MLCRTSAGRIEGYFWVQFAEAFERVEYKGRGVAAEDVFC